MTCRLRWYGETRNQMYNSNTADVWANSMACHPWATGHIAGCCHLVNSMLWSQSYVSHCRVLPLGEFTVMIPEPHATLQGAVTWRNQCHDSWSCHVAGCNNSIRRIENRFSPNFILFLLFNAVLALTSGGFRILSDTLVFWWDTLAIKNLNFTRRRKNQLIWSKW